jgi:hypothetical protein
MYEQEIIQTNLNGRTQKSVSARLSQIASQSLTLDNQAFARLATVSKDQLETMRPVLCLFLGGSGMLMALSLMVILTLRFGDAWRRKIRLLGFDTTEEPYSVQIGERLFRLEPGSEFFHIGNVPVGNIIRNIDNLPSIKERLGTAILKLPALAMRNGAKSNRLLGLLAFLWHYPTIQRQIRRALWSLARRDRQSADTARQQQGLNIFIGGSLVGGTCSGMFQDVAALTRSLVDELGAQGDFCHITGIGILPQAFQGVPVANLYPNTGAALNELNHLMTYGGFEATYPDGRQVGFRAAPFNLFYVLDGIDERGQTWAGIAEVAAMAAEGIYLQMASQLGSRGDNAFDNVDEILSDRTPEGDGTFLASFGLGYLEFPAPAVADLCGQWLLVDLARGEWLKAPDEEEASRQVAERLNPIAPPQLVPILLQDPATGGELRLDLRLPGWLSKKQASEVAAEAARYVVEYGHARVNEKFLRQIGLNAESLIDAQRQSWTDWANDTLLAPGASVPGVTAVLLQAQGQLLVWAEDGQGTLEKLEERHQRQAVTMAQMKEALARAGDSLPFGRTRRIREALDAYFEAVQTLYAIELERGQLRARLRIWRELAGHLDRLARESRNLAGRIDLVTGQVEVRAVETLQAVTASGVSRLSLADEATVRELYRQHAPSQANLMALPSFNQAPQRLTPLALAGMPGEQLGDLLLAALTGLFDSIRLLTIERIITEKAAEMTAQARRQQLFQLATPSWSIDRTRLPEGGAGLARIEVMGVPDAGDTLFDEEVTLVSAHDPYRLVALVVVAGAPQSALQQYQRYQQTLEQALAYRPMYVLPQFVTDAAQARLAFALGSIFGLIINRGAHFYYQPVDALATPLRLGNGLVNAVEALETQELLVREIAERVEGQIARLGLEQAIETLAEYYRVPPEGRSTLDEITRELKQLVRQYADELRQIKEFSGGVKS